MTRTHTVLTGRKTSIRPQRPWEYTKYSLRPFRRLAAFLPRQNCLHLTAMDFRVIFAFLSRRCVLTHQGEKGKKRRKDTLAGVRALVNRGYCFLLYYHGWSRISNTMRTGGVWGELISSSAVPARPTDFTYTPPMPPSSVTHSPPTSSAAPVSFTRSGSWA